MNTSPYTQFASQLAAICKSPDDDGPRLRFADLLCTTDNPMFHARAEYIRVQCRLAAPDPSGTVWADLYEQRESLEAMYPGGDWWAADLPVFKGIRFNPNFQRGFAYDIWCDNEKSFIQHASSIFTSQPIQSLSFRKLRSTNFFREVQELTHIKRLIIEDHKLGPTDAQNLADSPYMVNLSALHLSGNRLGDHGAQVFAGSNGFKSIKNLDLGHNDIGDEGVIALAESEIISSLEHLGLAGCDMTDAGAMALANSPKVEGIETLTLWHCYNVSTDGWKALRNRFGDRASCMD